MRTAPTVRGGARTRLASLVVGLVVMAVAIVCLLQSQLGLAPWDVLHQGIARTSPLSFGVALIVVGVAATLVAWALGERPGLGTVANATLIGVFVEALLLVWPPDSLASWPAPVRGAVLLAGIAAFGVGSALYIGAAFGAGPRDSLMLIVARRAGVRFGVARVALEVAALAAGWALGGTVGVGTLAFAVLIGPSVETSFRLLARSRLGAPLEGR